MGRVSRAERMPRSCVPMLICGRHGVVRKLELKEAVPYPNLPPAPDALTNLPQRSCRPYRSPITFPLGSDPSLFRFATAHCHACLCTSVRASALADCFGDVADVGVMAGPSGAGFIGTVARPLSGDAAQRTWRISNSYEPISANDGQAAIMRPITVGSATATLAARLAALPTTSSAHGSNSPFWPARESASRVVEAATIVPSTDGGVSAATHPG